MQYNQNIPSMVAMEMMGTDDPTVKLMPPPTASIGWGANAKETGQRQEGSPMAIVYTTTSA